MPYNIDPKQQAVRDEVRAFAEKEIYPVSEELDRMSEPRKFPVDLYRKIGAAGFIGYAMPKEYGGQGNRTWNISRWSKSCVTMIRRSACSAP